MLENSANILVIMRQREKEKYTHLNAEFQRIARGDKKAFLSDQFLKIEENNRMGKIRDLFNFLEETSSLSHSFVFLYLSVLFM